MPPAVVRACDEGRALLLSPAETGAGVNKQRAVWCNRYVHVLDNAFRIVCGCIRPGGTPETKGMGGGPPAARAATMAPAPRRPARGHRPGERGKPG